MIAMGGGLTSAAEAAEVLSCYRGLSSMANIEMTPHGPERPEYRRVHAAEKVTVGGSMAEALAGLGAVVLAILGLIGMLPFTMAAIATIVIGAGLLLRGSAISARFSELRRGLYTEGGRTRLQDGRGSLTIEMLGGLACIALGILALLGVNSALLLSIAPIVFGGTLLLGANVSSRLGELEAWQSGVDPRAVDVEREAGRGAAGSQMLVGIGAIVLGILALVGMMPGLTLILIAILAVGGAMLLSGAMVSTRMSHMMR